MKYLLLITTALLLNACSSAPAKINYYLLLDNVTAESNTKAESITIALNPVRVATYIDQRGLVLETADGEINIAKKHLWAEPLRDSLTGLLSDKIGESAGKNVYPGKYNGKEVTTHIDVSIKQLHGNNRGQAVIAAAWIITTMEDMSVTEYLYSDTDNLSESGYPALVASEKRLLNKLAVKIAASL